MPSLTNVNNINIFKNYYLYPLLAAQPSPPRSEAEERAVGREEERLGARRDGRGAEERAGREGEAAEALVERFDVEPFSDFSAK